MVIYMEQTLSLLQVTDNKKFHEILSFNNIGKITEKNNIKYLILEDGENTN